MPDPMAVACATATAVADLLRARWNDSTTQVRYKGAVDLVTDADLAAEELAIRLLRAEFPDHAIVAEESAPSAAPGANCWYVDPLDGTTNFAHRYPHVAVSIAFARQGEIVLGVVHDPLRDEQFAAARGAGATLNGQPIRVSDTPTLDRALLATGFPYDRRERAAFYVRHLERFLSRGQCIRRSGCAALDLCYVGCGRLDGFWEWNLKPWDTAAGALIVTESGGRISDFAGGRFSPHGAQALASNARIHDEMLAEMQHLLSSTGPARSD